MLIPHLLTADSHHVLVIKIKLNINFEIFCFAIEELYQSTTYVNIIN